VLLLLSQGGFSEVHLAQDKLTGKTVALKVVFLNKGGLTKEQVCALGLCCVAGRLAKGTCFDHGVGSRSSSTRNSMHAP
jgi:hypothetical protein